MFLFILLNLMFMLELFFLSINDVFNFSILFLLRDDIMLCISFSVKEPSCSFEEAQHDLDLEAHNSRTFFSSGMSNNTKGLDKSKEQNSVQISKCIISLTF